jgi:hypothetical protein
MEDKVDKIVELGIDLDDMDQDMFDEFGVDVISLVSQPAIEVDFLAFNKHEFVEPTAGESEDEFIGRCMSELEGEFPDQDQRLAVCYNSWETKLNAQQHATPEQIERVLEMAATMGEPINPEDITLDISNPEFSTVDTVLDGIKALGILERIRVTRGEPAETRYRYSGPTAERTFCKAMLRLNRLFTKEEIEEMGRDGVNSQFAEAGKSSYDIFQWLGGKNCKHWFEEVAVFYTDSGRKIMIDRGRAQGNAGKTWDQKMSYKFAIDEEKRIVTGPVAIARKFILRRDEDGNPYYVFFSGNTIRKMASKFLEMNNKDKTDIEHDGNVVTTNKLLESWVSDHHVHDKSYTMGFRLPRDTWYASYKINDDATWQSIKDGDLRGFSLAGAFLEKMKPEPKLTEDESKVKQIKDILDGIV